MELKESEDWFDMEWNTKNEILEKIITLWQDDENFNTVTTYVSKPEDTETNVGSQSALLSGPQRSRMPLFPKNVPNIPGLTVPVPIPMIENSVMNLPRQAPKK